MREKVISLYVCSAITDRQIHNAVFKTGPGLIFTSSTET